MATPTQTDYTFRDTITFSSSVVGVNSATLTDSAGNVLICTENISDTTADIPVIKVGPRILIENGVTLTVTNGTDTSTGTLNITPPQDYVVTTLTSVPSTPVEDDWVFGLETPAVVGDQVLCTNSFATHNADGTTFITGSGSYTYLVIQRTGAVVSEVIKTVVEKTGHITSGSKSVTVAATVKDSGISAVTGSVAKDGLLTIAGADFGLAPASDELIYDDCDGTGTRTVNDANFGTWTATKTTTFDGVPEYQSGGADGGNCLRVARYNVGNLTTSHYDQLWRTKDTRKFYMSCRFKLADNTFWPDFNVTGRDTVNGIVSSLKLMWPQYFDDENPAFTGGDVNDIVYPGQPLIAGIRGNDVPVIFENSEYDVDPYWNDTTLNDWIRFSFYIEVDADRANVSPIWFENIAKTNAGQQIYTMHKKLSPLNTSEPDASPVFNYFPFMTWMRGGDLTAANGGAAPVEDDVNLLVDDMYVSIGDNASARVEIGDNADYHSCTDRALCYPEDANWWQDGEIRVRAQLSGFDASTTPLYIFVIHSDNKRIMSYPLSTLQGL